MPSLEQSLELPTLTLTLVVEVLHKSLPGFVKIVPAPSPRPVTSQQIPERLTTSQKLPINSPKLVLPEDTHHCMEVSSPADGAPGTSQGAAVKRPLKVDLEFPLKVVEDNSSGTRTTVPSRKNRARAPPRSAMEDFDRGHR